MIRGVGDGVDGKLSQWEAHGEYSSCENGCENAGRAVGTGCGPAAKLFVARTHPQ